MRNQDIHIDVVIFGGGIAGLWLRTLLLKRGYSVLLFEKTALGAGQTIHAQGMLHAGMKYTLTGKQTEEAATARRAAQRWSQCLSGTGGDFDLISANILKQGQVLWGAQGLVGRASSFFASHMLKGRVEKTAGAQWPEIFQQAGGRAATLRTLDETVLDMPSLLQTLARKAEKRGIYQAAAEQFNWETKNGKLTALTGPEGLRVVPKAVFLTAGLGNATLKSRLPLVKWPASQQRPLRMVMLKPAPCELFGHCVGSGPKPRVTISTHTDATGTKVWYLGGNIAEKGALLSPEETIAMARKEMSRIFPWMDFTNRLWATRYISRAEPRWESGHMPGRPMVSPVLENVFTAWPVKMTFTPEMGDLALSALREAEISPSQTIIPSLGLPVPDIAKSPWDEESFHQC